MSNLIKYGIAAVTFTASQNIFHDKKCKAVAIVNTGDTLAFLNDVPVFPSSAPATIRGDSFEFSGDDLEVFDGNLTLKFASPVGAAPSVCVVVQYYK